MDKTIMTLVNEIQNTENIIEYANQCTLIELTMLMMFGYTFICMDGRIAEVRFKNIACWA